MRAFTTRLATLLLTLAPLALVPALATACSRSSSPSAPAAQSTHDATGVIKSFGDGRKTVRIAHDEIPGYMKPMTMTFDAKGPEQLEGLGENDNVAFTFTDEPDGRYVLQSIKKRLERTRTNERAIIANEPLKWLATVALLSRRRNPLKRVRLGSSR